LDDAMYDPGFDEPGAKPRRPGLPVEPRRVLRILLPQRRRLGIVFVAASALALLALLFVPETYSSEAVLLYEGSPLLEGGGGAPSVRAFVQSAVAPSRLGEVRTQLGWDVTLDALAERVRASQESESSIRLSATAPTAQESYVLARAVLDDFLGHQAAFNAKELERLAAENDGSHERATARRDAAQAAFNAVREKSGKPDLLDEKEQLLKRAAVLRSRADEAAVEIAAQSALITELEQARKDIPQQIVGSATKGSAVDAPLSKARSELAQARASLSEEHPRVLALKERVANLQSQKGAHRVEIGGKTLISNPARASVEQQLASARGSLAAARERHAAVEVLLANIQREAELLAPVEGEARQAVSELDAAVARVEALTARGAALRDAMLAPITGFRILSAPVVPERAKKAMPVVVLLILLPVLVTVIYALVLLARALRSLRVEAPREVAWWGNGPVLGTSVWPRQPDALDDFVDELEDQGVYGAGRTLVVPATEAEREIACSFAMRLADAPWLAAAILDVERSVDESQLVTPPPSTVGRRLTPRPEMKRLSSQGTPSVPQARTVRHKPTMHGVVPPSAGTTPAPTIITPSPGPESAKVKPASSRPPRKRTVIGLPAVGPSGGTEPRKPIQIEARPVTSSTAPPMEVDGRVRRSDGPQPFRRKRGAKATVRMVVPRKSTGGAEASSAEQLGTEEDAFLLTRPVPTGRDDATPRAGRAVHVGTETPYASASNAVMRAAVRLLGDDEDDSTEFRRSQPPAARPAEEVTGVALAWNGPLSGPVLRRAARLAHRVVVVVSSGLSAVALTRVKTRLGREGGVGYVFVNLEEAYLDTEDRVGPVEEFWQGARDAESLDSRRS